MNITPGTIPFEAVMWLRAISPMQLSTAELAHCIGRSAKRLPEHLAEALSAGLVARRVVAGTAFWAQGHAELVAPPKPIVCIQPGPLAHPSVFHYAQTFQEVSL